MATQQNLLDYIKVSSENREPVSIKSFCNQSYTTKETVKGIEVNIASSASPNIVGKILYEVIKDKGPFIKLTSKKTTVIIDKREDKDRANIISEVVDSNTFFVIEEVEEPEKVSHKEKHKSPSKKKT